jgi:RNA polymerase sigma-70 factor (ECF subfamily)
MNDSELRTQLERLHPASYGWALSCSRRDPQLAEDVLQTVYLKVLQGRARYDGRAEFKTWLFAVIRRTAADELRRLWWRRLRWQRHEQEPVLESSVPGPDREAERTEAHRWLARALDALPARQRQVLHLVFYQDLSVQQAAAVMRVSAGSARQHYGRGKQRLREWLQQNETGHESRYGRQPAPATLP